VARSLSGLALINQEIHRYYPLNHITKSGRNRSHRLHATRIPVCLIRYRWLNQRPDPWESQSRLFANGAQIMSTSSSAQG